MPERCGWGTEEGGPPWACCCGADCVLWCFSPRSGFFLFCSEFRPKIKSTNPGISIGDVAKKLGEMWNNLSDGEKQPYNNKAAKLKEKYEKVRLVLTCASSIPALVLVFLYLRPS